MNSNEFVKEVLASDLCPKDFEQLYDKFCFYQREVFRTLQELHRVCEKNGVPYQLAYGSLLGVIRDGGQIPWDYDIDVFVPYSHKKMLIDALTRDLSDEYYFYCPETNKKCRHMIMRLAPKGYRTEALHVDVFYYIGSPNEEDERRKLMQEIKKISHLRYTKLVDPKEESIGNVRRMLGMYKRKLPVMFINIKKTKKRYDQLCQLYAVEESDICLEADGFADKYYFPKQYMINTELLTTDVGVFRVSSHYKELLSLWYGDYMSIPPLKNRIDEVINSMKRLRFFDDLINKGK